MSNEIIYRESINGIKGKELFQKGLNKSCDIVSATMGGRGSNNIFETFSGLPMITSDGWKSLEQLQWKDPVEQIALNILKESCEKTFEVIGDGTTTTCVLVQAFFNNSIIELLNGINSIEIKEKIENSLVKILEYIDNISIPLTPKLMYNVAKTSAHGDDDIAKHVTGAFEKSGEHGIVSHSRSFTDETFINHIAGNPLDSGYTHEGFVNVQLSQSVVYVNPLVLVSETYLETTEQVVPFLNYAIIQNRPIVLIANCEGVVQDVVLDNVFKHKAQFCIVKPPYIGKKGRETLTDIALVLGCEVLSGIPRVDFGDTESSYLGTCARIEIGKKDTIIYPSKEVDSQKRTSKIEELLEQVSLQKHDLEKNYLRERISKLTGGISTIMVGGITPSETEERIDRFDDAIKAVRSAKDGGVVAGGGVALFYANTDLNLDNVTSKSIDAPILKILSNAGIKSFKKSSYPMGYDVKKYKEVNMFEAGIIDTAKGLKVSLQNAVSTLINLLRTDNIITYERIKNGK
jgi:chaperonin GroEL